MTLKKKKLGGPTSARINRKGLAALTDKQRKFIDEYMVDRNIARAMVRAGYDIGPNTNPAAYGSRLLATPCIRAEIDRREEERARRCDVSSDDILLELKRIAFYDVASMFTKEGKFRGNPMEMNLDERRALVNFDIITIGKDGDYIVKAQPGNKLKALELLGRYRKLFTDKVETSGTTTVTFSEDFSPAPGTEEAE